MAKKYNPKGPTEWEIQTAAVAEISRLWPGLLYCASAGGMRTSIGTAVKIKRAGYKKGFPDLFIYEPRGIFYGLALEIKRPSGIVSPEQLTWADELIKRRYDFHFCYSVEAVITAIVGYLSGLRS